MNKYNLAKLIFYFSCSFLLIAAKPDLSAQSGFAKAIPIDANVNIDDIIFHQDHLILRGNIAIDSLGLLGLLIVSLDTNGILLWSTIIYDTSLISNIITNTPGRFMVTQDDHLAIPVKYFNTGQLAIYYTTLEGIEDFHYFYEYGDGIIFPYNINQIKNEYYLTGVISYSGGDLNLFALKLKSNGDMVWIRYFGLPNLFEGSLDADVNPDQTLTIYASRNDRDFILSGAKDGWKQPWILTIDSSGTIVEEWIGERNDPRTLGGGYFIRMKNGDWILQGTHYKNVPGEFGEEVKTSPTVTRLDSNFNLIWKVYLSNYEERYSDQIHDMEYDSLQGHIVVTGGKYISVGNENEYVNWTIKMDTSGQILWNMTDSVYYSRQNAHHTAGLAISPSGSIYVGGYVTVNELEPRSQAFVIKYTPDGCSDTLCTTTSILEQIRNEHINVVLYPNPARDMLHVRIKSLPGDAYLRITDLQGRVLASHKVIEGENSIDLNLPSGMYICTIVGEGKMVYSGKVVVR